MFLTVLILAVVEGITEFLPVSSTGHLVVGASLLAFNPPWREPFLVVIQLGAIIAVVVDRRADLWRIVTAGALVRFSSLLLLGFLPSAVLGLLFHTAISSLLKTPLWVSVAWVLGGLAILALDRPRPGSDPDDSGPGPERKHSTDAAPRGRRNSAEAEAQSAGLPNITAKQAALVGLSQCLSLWPGVSRSASTILGGLAVGLDRRAATLWSFYLAIPTMFAASGYELYKFRDAIQGAGLWFLLGMCISFGVAWLSVRWLLHYVQTHTFRPFGIYRIIAGVVLLLMPSEWLT